MRKPFLALLSVLIACVSLSACATFPLPTAHLERTRVTPAGLRFGAAFGRESSPYTQFTADGGGPVPRSERHAHVMRYGATFGATLSAPMNPVNCIAATSTPCNTSGNPGNGSQGDPAWLAFGKLNAWGTQLGLFQNDTANEVLATPDGASGIPALRALVGNDIPPINLAVGTNGGVTGILGVTSGGTGVSTAGIVGGTQYTVTGTGACASITKIGTTGATVGEFRCTGTTGSSSFTVALPAAPNAWACSASDVTTPANVLAQGAGTTTADTFSGTVNANDYIKFLCLGF